MPTHVSARLAPEDLWLCQECGWTYPNHHPSAKHRRNHKKQCPGNSPGAPVSRLEIVSDYDAQERCHDDHSSQKAHEENGHNLPIEEMASLTQSCHPSRLDRVETTANRSPQRQPDRQPAPKCQESGLERLVSFSKNETVNGHGMNSPAADVEKSLDNVQVDNVAALPDTGSVHDGPSEQGKSLLSSRAVEGKRICRHCGWDYPNAHPSARNRRKHKRKCGAGVLAGARCSSDKKQPRGGAIAENGFDISTDSRAATSAFAEKSKETSVTDASEQENSSAPPGAICANEGLDAASPVVEMASNSLSPANVEIFSEVISIDQPVFHSFGQTRNGVTAAAWTNLNVASNIQTLEEPELSKFQEVKDILSTSGETSSMVTGNPVIGEEAASQADEAVLDKVRMNAVEIESPSPEAIPSEGQSSGLTTGVVSLKVEPATAFEMMKTRSPLEVTRIESSISRGEILGEDSGLEVCTELVESELDSFNSHESTIIVDDVISVKHGNAQAEYVQGSACKDVAKEVSCRIDSIDPQMPFAPEKIDQAREGTETGTPDSSCCQITHCENPVSPCKEGLDPVIRSPEVDFLHPDVGVLGMTGKEDTPVPQKSTSVADLMVKKAELSQITDQASVHEVIRTAEQAKVHEVTRIIEAKVHEVVRSPEQCSSPSSREGFVRTRVEEFEKLAGVHRRKCFSPSTSTSPRTPGSKSFSSSSSISPRTPGSKPFSPSSSSSPHTPGSKPVSVASATSPRTPGSKPFSSSSSTSPRTPGSKPFNLSTATSPRAIGSKSFASTSPRTPRSTLQYGSVEKSQRNLQQQGAKELKEAISHPRREQQSHVKTATTTPASPHDLPAEVQEVMSHLRHRGPSPELRADKQKASKVVDSKPVSPAQHSTVLVCHG